MKNLYNRFSGKNLTEKSAKVSLFFTENNTNGYKSKDGLKGYFNQLTELDFLRFERMFELMFKKFPINNYLNVVTDPRDGEEVVWLKFKLPNSQQNLRIIYDEDILRFIQHYQEGVFRNGFNLEELIIEAGLELESKD